MHGHLSSDLKDKSVMGCIRKGVRVWQVMEVVIQELTGTGGKRLLNKELCFKLLEP